MIEEGQMINLKQPQHRRRRFELFRLEKLRISIASDFPILTYSIADSVIPLSISKYIYIYHPAATSSMSALLFASFVSYNFIGKKFIKKKWVPKNNLP